MRPAFVAAFWGCVSGGALVLGAGVGYFAKVPGKVVAGVMAFGSGRSRSAFSKIWRGWPQRFINFRINHNKIFLIMEELTNGRNDRLSRL